MMSRYADGNDYSFDSYSPSDSPRGRRYILKNLNTKKLHQLDHLDTSRKIHDDYHDIRTAAPSSISSVNTNHSNKHIGTANKVMPTESPRKTPRKPLESQKQTPREPFVYVKQRKDLNASVVDERNETQKKTPRKGDKSPRKGGKEDSKNNVVAINKKNEKGLTPRDEYMVTNLYDKSREIIYLKPSEVRYTHDQITAHFTDGRSMLQTFIALLYGRVEIRLGGNDVPPIEVMQTREMEGGKEGNLWYVVNGNRRLYVFRKLERCGALTTMQVIARKYDAIEMDKQFLTRNHGRTISVTNDATLNAKFGKETKRWKEWKAKQPKKKPTKESSCCTIS
ncbi:uncharacterized protein LOC132725418 isoform X2 [Ruditapes philippinarum]|uniref:uncharacterized protein LOC132725418 isoform X2 n=1 Tax=Ruditapes philippinarum TaxID=129788 RepID=UPI00295AA22C|nr:uncharacterized protein LOC132725418 isoform X2 [Ruditapes philippinarum]